MNKPIEPNQKYTLSFCVYFIEDIMTYISNQNNSVADTISDYLNNVVLYNDRYTSDTLSEIIKKHNENFPKNISRLSDIFRFIGSPVCYEVYDNFNIEQCLDEYGEITIKYYITLETKNKNYDAELKQYEIDIAKYHEYCAKAKETKKLKAQQYKATRAKIDGDRLVMVKDILYPFVQSHNLPFTLDDLNKGLAKYKQAVQIYNTLNKVQIKI